MPIMRVLCIAENKIVGVNHSIIAAFLLLRQ